MTLVTKSGQAIASWVEALNTTRTECEASLLEVQSGLVVSEKRCSLSLHGKALSHITRSAWKAVML